MGIVELDGIKEKEMKKRFTKEYKQRIKLIMKSNLNSSEYLGSRCDEIWGWDSEVDERGTGETRQTDAGNYDNEWSVTPKE